MNDAYAAARQQIGTWEWKGDDHNPKIVQWFADVGHSWVVDDETAWCAAFVGAMLKAGGFPHTGALNARSYTDYGQHVDIQDAQPGDIVVFSRGDPKGWQGHVGFFVRRDGDNIVVLGGNQANQVNESRYPVKRLLAVRRVVKQRTSRMQSTTLQAGAGALTTAGGTLAAILGGLSENAQVIMVVGLLLISAFVMYMMKERLRAWAAGWRS